MKTPEVGGEDPGYERSQEIICYYTNDQWREAIDRTRLYIEKLSRRQNRGLEKLPHEWINDAIDKLLTGQRKWLPAKHTLSVHLIHIFRSDYSHFIERSKKHESLESSFSAPEKLSNRESPDEVLMRQQHLSSVENNISNIKKVIDKRGDVVAKRIIEAYEINDIPYHKNSELAEHLGVAVKEIVNAKKRIERITMEKEEVE